MDPVTGAMVAQGVGALAGGLLGKSSSPKSSKWYRDQVKSLYGQASDIASRPFEEYTDPRFADFTPDQMAAFDMVRNNLGLGSGAVNQAIAGAQGAMNYSPNQVTAGSINAPTIGVNYNPNQISPQMLNGSYNYSPSQIQAGTVSADTIKEKSFLDYDINKYMNPYISNVVDQSLSDIEKARLETENANKADMMASNAWGGSRSGVAQSLTNREYGNTAAATSANLRNQGFNAASNLISQDANRNLAASQSNQSASLQAGISNASLALQAALANQAAGMRNAEFGANYGLQQGLANQSADMQGQLANLQSSQFGANLGLNAAQSNQQALLNAALANQQQALNAAMANQSAGLQANQQTLYGSNLLGNLGGMQQGMAATDASNLLKSGMLQQAQAQQPLDFAYQQYLMGQNWDQNQLGFLQGFLKDPKGVAGQYPQQNPALGMLGGALTGANLAGNIFGAWNQTPTAPQVNVPYSPGGSGPYASGYMNPTPFNWLNTGSY